MIWNRHGVRRPLMATILLSMLALIIWLASDRKRAYDPSRKPITYVASSYNWGEARANHPVTNMHRLPRHDSKTLPRIEHSKPLDRFAVSESAYRKEAVRSTFKESWDAYVKYAWGADELKPLSRSRRKTLHGWGAQIVDALDALWMMGFKDDFRAGVRHVAQIDWSTTRDDIDFFEVTIRYLGGLLAAHDLSGEPHLLQKAVELGDMLYAAFDTPSRRPVGALNLGKAKAGTQLEDKFASVAALSSFTVEFTRLSQLTRDDKYYDATVRIKRLLQQLQDDSSVPGLMPQMVNAHTGDSALPSYMLGSQADSAFEYLPKMLALLEGADDDYVNMTTRALDAALENLMYKPATTTKQDVLLPALLSTVGGKRTLIYKMEHLMCFAGGMYALAGKLLERKDYVDAAGKLTQGCIWLYEVFPSGVMAESQELRPCLRDPCDQNAIDAAKVSSSLGLKEGVVSITDAHYNLRPEAIESVYYMWKITGDEKWRDDAWRMWKAIVRTSAAGVAFANADHIERKRPTHEDKMEVSTIALLCPPPFFLFRMITANTVQTFWLSETVKYFYMIFDDSSEALSLDDWVLNTEAHPLKRTKGYA